MRFTLYTPGERYAAQDSFFRVHSDSISCTSPYFATQQKAIQAMENLVWQLRDEPGDKSPRVIRTEDTYVLSLWESPYPPFLPATTFEEAATAQTALDTLRQAAEADTFPLLFLELDEPIAELPVMQQWLAEPKEHTVNWREVGDSLLRIKEKKTFGFRPDMGAQVNMIPNPCEPIFNAMQPFVSADLPLFHGRKREVSEVEALITEFPTLLLYGPPRVGKTSLIQCGLANKLGAAPGEVIIVRRQAAGIFAALREGVREAIGMLGGQLDEMDQDITGLLRYADTLTDRPIWLVLDQLEYLFDTPVLETERREFFQLLRTIEEDEDLLYRVILVVREGFLAPLVEYETELPSLLQNRYRLQPLKQGSMFNATVNLLDILSLQQKLTVDQPEIVADKICSQLADENGNVPVQCLQMYMHQLHQNSCRETESGPVPFTSELVDRMGSAQQVIDTYITEKLAALNSLLPTDGTPPDPLVQRQIDELEQSRVQCGCQEKKSQPPAIAAATAVAPVVVPPQESNLRGLLLVSTLGLALSWLLFNWWFGPNELDDPCRLAREADTCEAYVSYLCEYGDTTGCAPAFAEILDTRDCAVWQDYRLLQRTPTCGTLQAFYAKYRDSNICTDHIRAQLLDWECPLVRDTVQITLRDTVIERIPMEAVVAGPRTPANDNPPCAEFENTNFKQVGPLWIMTDALAGGPYTWADALEACVAKGWRMPCIGEVDYLIENIYRDRPDRAYDMLTGPGECALANPAEAPNGRIEFWTATESNDALAWSYYFDTASETLGRAPGTPKSARLPCLCVQKVAGTGTAMPPCYQKTIDRRSGQ